MTNYEECMSVLTRAREELDMIEELYGMAEDGELGGDATTLRGHTKTLPRYRVALARALKPTDERFFE